MLLLGGIQARTYGKAFFHRYSLFTVADLIGAADTIVKVPQMAESITEGTLKQFTKRMFPTEYRHILNANLTWF